MIQLCLTVFLVQAKNESCSDVEVFLVYIGNDVISLSKEFFGKNGSKLAQRSPTNAHADV